jgi:hypothetical protein
MSETAKEREEREGPAVYMAGPGELQNKRRGESVNRRIVKRENGRLVVPARADGAGNYWR